MSKKEQGLLITPPLFPAENPQESETFSGFNCGYCFGNGWIPALGERNERVHEECKVCKGSGKLKAIVTISWIPDKKEK